MGYLPFAVLVYFKEEDLPKRDNRASNNRIAEKCRVKLK